MSVIFHNAKNLPTNIITALSQIVNAKPKIFVFNSKYFLILYIRARNKGTKNFKATINL